MQKAAKRRVAIAEIIKLGGWVGYNNASDGFSRGKRPGWFSWLRKLYGDEYLGNAVVGSLTGTQITDAELVHLKDLTNLEYLNLQDTQITDAGLVNLKELTGLEELWLKGTQITDAGLVHLKGLTSLEYLELRGTQITDAGLVDLKGFTNLKYLDLHGTRITDAGLVHLKGLTNLEYLNLQGTQASEEVVEKLQQTLPNCQIPHLPLPSIDQISASTPRTTCAAGWDSGRKPGSNAASWSGGWLTVGRESCVCKQTVQVDSSYNRLSGCPVLGVHHKYHGSTVARGGWVENYHK